MDKFIKHQALTETQDFDLKYMTIGLCGEVGEVCNEIKKMERDDVGKVTKERLHKIKLEMGDVLWYYIGICRKLKIDFNEILELNDAKLREYDDYEETVKKNLAKNHS